MKLSKQALIALGITGAGVLGCSRTELTREQLDKMLVETAKKPVTSELREGAMCYSRGEPSDPERTEYVCPLCKTKTYHTKRENVWHVQDAMKYRRQIKRVNKLGLNATLDETDLCSQCRRDKTTDIINFDIVVAQDNRSIRTQLWSFDLTLLIAFLEKKDVWGTGNDGTRPLKNELPRIREILGMDEDGTTLEAGD